ncbi:MULTISPECIES: exopolysaccharide biosynthesis polyprenyl glycosylphosphotransferase [unclassified Polaribacter]|uniref:exopolysaccharide biosynthesis polyprenyl glycosylphosphotransferase n=1 Tax=unclassified Polaribacter TaxID=196858 RepID=UPI0011BD6E57|nr:MULTISPECIES: exopolysaccharide biosynthesis polyprenyl glycosylphosphotransferase [unclassified Polaribacter]TXD54230.1 exopolysaccharide biosynthesis polyprenyl glycosylphosphotransferase [Polaribacter sp. IC063]TXD57128.1 exopolysaccharide biosynthesis polyprenyl glycosylphosphotransferase [Polaribacter sp. IC066]
MKKRYSYLIRPLQLIIDLIIINFVVYFVNDTTHLNAYFLAYISLFWIISSHLLGFYKVFRFTRILRVFTLLVRQFFIFIFGYFAYFGIFSEGEVVNNQFLLLVYIVLSLSIIKILWLFILKRYRSLGNNLRTTIVLGFDQSAKNIIKLFKSKSNLGYKYLGFFSNKEYKNKELLGNLSEVFKYVNNNAVDEIYCSLNVLTKDQIKNISKFATEKNITLKLIPDSIELYSKNQSVEYYDDALMVLNVNRLPFEFAENFYIKRIFDIIFSLLVCLFVLSWLIPILWVIVKLESKGPLVFKQKREGLNCEEFVCYKFRSMRLNEFSHKVHAVKNDSRVTVVGAFLRKTSMDELPQFLNVLQGNMSVVGPRPHIEVLSLEYQKYVDDYLKRHIVKPGITGLAQVSGYRGEVKRTSDIKNRVRLDIFYIENWSFLLDLKIIIKTILNVFKGEEKAY